MEPAMTTPKPEPQGAKPMHKRISFILRHDHAKDVVITGDFTGWTEGGVRLTRNAKGEWQTVLNLLPGEHQYRLRIDGRWEDHPHAAKRVPNPFGTENCVLIVE
jgi:1,4-alpha-glucan branching enzyme